MEIREWSAAFTLADEAAVARTRDFYVEHLGAQVAVDHGWYVSLRFPGGRGTMQFMSAGRSGHPVSATTGLVCNFRVENVDRFYRRFSAAGLAAVDLDADYPLGDRGVAIRDPNGFILYFYSEEEPDDYWIRFSH